MGYGQPLYHVHRLGLEAEGNNEQRASGYRSFLCLYSWKYQEHRIFFFSAALCFFNGSNGDGFFYYYTFSLALHVIDIESTSLSLPSYSSGSLSRFSYRTALGSPSFLYHAIPLRVTCSYVHVHTYIHVSDVPLPYSWFSQTRDQVNSGLSYRRESHVTLSIAHQIGPHGKILPIKTSCHRLSGIHFFLSQLASIVYS
jgi:hypothetical protein